MPRNIFGWDLPPGVTQRMIDNAYGEEAPCEVCGQWPDDCICPECPQCGEYGNPTCYDGHGLVRSLGQVVLRAELEERIAAENARWDAYAAEYAEEIDR